MAATVDPRAGHRADLERYLRAVEPNELLAAAEGLALFERPVLVAWGAEDRLMPAEHGTRLAQLLPEGRLVSIADSGTLIPLDNPIAFADAIRKFVSEVAADGSR